MPAATAATMSSATFVVDSFGRNPSWRNRRSEGWTYAPRSDSNLAHISVSTGQAPDAHAIPIAKENAEMAMDAAACIGCGACVASCKNASAMLFTAAKVSQFALLPQGQAERDSRVLGMVEQMDAEGFGNCTNESECEAACPKAISVDNIARMNRDYLRATLRSRG